MENNEDPLSSSYTQLVEPIQSTPVNPSEKFLRECINDERPLTPRKIASIKAALNEIELNHQAPLLTPDRQSMQDNRPRPNDNSCCDDDCCNCKCSDEMCAIACGLCCMSLLNGPGHR